MGSRAQAASPDRQPDTRHLGRSEIGPRELGLFQQVRLPTFISNPAGCNVFPHCILGTTFFSGLACDTQRHWGGDTQVLGHPKSPQICRCCRHQQKPSPILSANFSALSQSCKIARGPQSPPAGRWPGPLRGRQGDNVFIRKSLRATSLVKGTQEPAFAWFDRFSERGDGNPFPEYCKEKRVSTRTPGVYSHEGPQGTGEGMGRRGRRRLLTLGRLQGLPFLQTCQEHLVCALHLNTWTHGRVFQPFAAFLSRC